MQLKFGADPEVATVIKASRNWRPITYIYEDPRKQLAIGLDGQRDTASLEFRPGIQDSADVVVDVLSDLAKKAHDYYHPPEVAYVAGAWVDPEPLGGHVHISWERLGDVPEDDGYVDERMVGRLISGLNALHHRLNHEWFPEDQINRRHRYAIENRKDFGKLGSFRAEPHQVGTLYDVVNTCHIEYRYSPSWMLTPEMAYTYIGGTEVIARHVIEQRDTTASWKKFVSDMLDGGEFIPVGGLSIKQAYALASKHLKWDEDFLPSWLG